jgi:biotin carboxyl carrier protein
MARSPKSLEIHAEMVGNVMSVQVAPGERVRPGDTVVLLESMKMEIPVLSEHDGTVESVHVDPGDVVQEGDLLVSLQALTG